MCFLKVDGFKHKAEVNGYAVEGKGEYAAVLKFKLPPTKHHFSSIVNKGTTETQLHLLNVDIIKEPLHVSVVRDHGNQNKYFVVGNRNR